MLTDRERAYDYYVTVERASSWNRGYNAAYMGDPFDDEFESSPQAYQDGWDAAVAEGWND